jgi:sugar lactone lactonase YvrE
MLPRIVGQSTHGTAPQSSKENPYVSARNTLVLLLFACPALTSPAYAERLYVSLETANQIVSYDLSLSSSAAVVASRQIFASTNLYSPYGLAFDSAGNLYVANTNGVSPSANTISKFDSSGNFMLSMSRPGWINPYDVAFDSNENLFVCADVSGTGGYAIVKFSKEGAFLGFFGSNPNANIPGAGGLAFDSSDNLYVTSYDNTSFVKFNSSGSLVSTTSNGVSDPYDITFAAGSLYVANSMAQVTKYTTAGALVSTIGASSNLDGTLGVAVDAAGNVYASNGDEIYKFNSAGVFQFSWPTPGASTYMTVAAVVPEPSTYAMALAGLACGGYLVRRRRKRA